jgi:hypothetical protein
MKLKVDHPSYEKGTELSVENFPVLLVNGSTVEIDADDVKAYEEATGKKIRDVIKGIAGVTIEGGGK